MSFARDATPRCMVHGYKQWGDDVVNHLNGMFGFAIWDVRKQRLVIARDPFGIKLIYYKIDRGRLYFGSEIRAVRAALDEPAEVDPNALNLFLRYRYTPSPHTIFKGIRKLAAWFNARVREGKLPGSSLVQLPAHAVLAREAGPPGSRRIA